MAPSAVEILPFFLERGPEHLFCIATTPRTHPPSRGVLYVHPFAEEMHKSRRMAALQARALAEVGYAVLQVDLYGCGDSSGDFGQANWEIWRGDIHCAYSWLAAKVSGPITLWGLRVGATLAVDVAPQLERVSNLILWQPIQNGSQYLTQFLRIKVAAEMLSPGQAKTTTKSLLDMLKSGEAIEVGGYSLSPEMARQLGSLRLVERSPRCAIDWFEIAAQPGATVSPASALIVDAWRDAGIVVNTATVAGEPFWATQEISECEALIAATIDQAETHSATDDALVASIPENASTLAVREKR